MTDCGYYVGDGRDNCEAVFFALKTVFELDELIDLHPLITGRS